VYLTSTKTWSPHVIALIREACVTHATLAETWDDAVTNTLINELASEAPSDEEQQEWTDQMMDFLDSATIHPLNIKGQGGRISLHFNVYAKGDIIEDDDTWQQLRTYLRNRVYRTTLIGTGRAIANNFICGLCHGHDHPRGLCPFPQIVGWNGGGRFTKRTGCAGTQGQANGPPPPPPPPPTFPNYQTRAFPHNNRRRF
jgi:hypothetical protein